VSGELQGLVNVCEGTISLNYTLVGSVNLNVKWKHFEGSFNRDFEFSGSMIGPPSADPWYAIPHSIESLKWWDACEQ
jgi:hypothetical protein